MIYYCMLPTTVRIATQVSHCLLEIGVYFDIVMLLFFSFERCLVNHPRMWLVQYSHFNRILGTFLLATNLIGPIEWSQNWLKGIPFVISTDLDVVNWSRCYVIMCNDYYSLLSRAVWDHLHLLSPLNHFSAIIKSLFRYWFPCYDHSYWRANRRGKSK